MVIIGRVVWLLIMAVGVVLLVSGVDVGAQIAVIALVAFVAWNWILENRCHGYRARGRK